MFASVIAVSVMLTGCQSNSGSANSNTEHKYYNDTTGQKQNGDSVVVSKVYDLDISLDYQRTANIATYTVDVYVDSEYWDTMTREHLLIGTYGLKEGSHEIVLKMKKENHPDFNYEVKKTVNMTRDKTVTGKFKCQYDKLEFTEWKES